VREALKHLAGLDLITIRPHRGAVVSQPRDAPTAELFEALAEAEAAARGSPPSRCPRASGSAWRRCTGPTWTPPPRRTSGRPGPQPLFHEAVHLGAHNAFLSDLAQTLRRRLAPYARRPFAAPERPAASALEHGAVLAAILDRDGPAAEEAMRRHVAEVGRAWAQGS
jgi:DNA-binding GntR family transcriptional regulator